MTAVSLTIPFAEATGGDCSSVLLEVPEMELTGGDTVPIRLWAGSASELRDYSLYHGGQSVGAGKILPLGGDVFQERVTFTGADTARLSWPVGSIGSATAATELVRLDASGAPRVVASVGQRLAVARQGGSCVRIRSGGALYGTLLVSATRVVPCKVWQWTAPTDQPGTHHFFVVGRGGGETASFSLELPAPAYEGQPVDVRLRLRDSCSEAPVAGARVSLSGAVAGVTDAAGEVYLSGVLPGDYQLSASAEGYLPTDQDDLDNERLKVR